MHVDIEKFTRGIRGVQGLPRYGLLPCSKILKRWAHWLLQGIKPVKRGTRHLCYTWTSMGSKMFRKFLSKERTIRQIERYAYVCLLTKYQKKKKDKQPRSKYRSVVAVWPGTVHWLMMHQHFEQSLANTFMCAATGGGFLLELKKYIADTNLVTLLEEKSQMYTKSFVWCLPNTAAI